MDESQIEEMQETKGCFKGICYIPSFDQVSAEQHCARYEAGGISPTEPDGSFELALSRHFDETSESVYEILDAHRNSVTAMKAQIAELEAKIDRFLRGDFKQFCAYCGWESIEGTWAELQDHIHNCDEHPLGIANKRIAELEADKCTGPECGKPSKDGQRITELEAQVAELMEFLQVICAQEKLWCMSDLKALIKKHGGSK